MRIFLTGGGGQLGRELQRRLAGSDLMAPARKELDITDESLVSAMIGDYKPDVVIHAAAWTKVDAAEENAEQAWRINAVGAQNLAMACRQVKTAMVYISTDYVFDGRLGRAYTEFDTVNPLNVYGQSKYAGEVLTRQQTERLYVLRTAWLFGDGTNFVRTMLNLAREREEVSIVDDQVGCPTSTVDLAEAVLRIIETKRYGTYHVVNSGQTSWYGFAKKILELAGNTRVKIRPVTTTQFARLALRPAYSPMNTRLLRLVLGWSPRSWEEALAEYLASEVVAVKGSSN